MKRIYTITIVLVITLLIVINAMAQPVAINGSLSISGNKVVNKNGVAVSFAGNSLFWSNDGWGGEKYYNASVVSWLRNDWNSGIVRAAMGVQDAGGYLSNKAGNKAKVKTVVDAAIANGMYVIIDWHSHNAEANVNEAIDFFKEMAQTYGNSPNVIYEIYNEPINSSWSNDIKPYAEKVIDAIRAIDPDNIIIVGTRFYSAYVNEAADNPILRKNIAYTIHFYAAQHKQDYRNRCQYALDKGVALFATEWGSVNADGGGNVDETETYAWMDFLKRNNISHCNWSINDKNEGASALNQGASSQGNWSSSNLTWSGSVVRNILKSYDYGTVKDGLSFVKAPIIASAKLSYTFTIDYTALQKRDLIVSLLDNQGAVVASTLSQVTGSGTKDFVLNLQNQPIIGRNYSFSAEIRPVGGAASSAIEKKVISNISFVNQDPLAVIEAESYANMLGVKTEACVDGGENVGYLDAGDWMSFPNVSIPEAGKYTVYYRVASASTSGKLNLEKDAGKTLLGSIAVPNTGDWQTWNTISQVVDLPAGSFSLGLAVPTGGYNLNMFAIARVMNVTAIDNADIHVDDKLSVFPNPAKDFISISGRKLDSKIFILNVLGELIIESSSEQIDISSLTNGVYFIQNNGQTIKFVKE